MLIFRTRALRANGTLRAASPTSHFASGRSSLRDCRNYECTAPLGPFCPHRGPRSATASLTTTPAGTGAQQQRTDLKHTRERRYSHNEDTKTLNFKIARGGLYHAH